MKDATNDRMHGSADAAGRPTEGPAERPTERPTERVEENAGDMPHGHCPLCAVRLAPAFAHVPDYEYGAEGDFGFGHCAECGLLVLTPQPGIEQLKAAYPPHYHGFHTGAKGLVGLLYRLVYGLRVRAYGRLLPRGGRLLDVGCADAAYFDALVKARPDVVPEGVEFIDDIAQRARDRGFRVVTGTLADMKDAEPYDVIIMNNLIEHVTDPVAELEQAVRLLRPGGHIVVETPNTDSWDYVVAGRWWGGLHVPRHTYLFGPVSLDRLAALCGLRLASRTFQPNTDHWALSVQNRLQATASTRRPLTRGRAWYYKWLLLAFLPLNIVQAWLRKSGSFVSVYRRTS